MASQASASSFSDAGVNRCLRMTSETLSSLLFLSSVALTVRCLLSFLAACQNAEFVKRTLILCNAIMCRAESMTRAQHLHGDFNVCPPLRRAVIWCVYAVRMEKRRRHPDACSAWLRLSYTGPGRSSQCKVSDSAAIMWRLCGHTTA